MRYIRPGFLWLLLFFFVPAQLRDLYWIPAITRSDSLLMLAGALACSVGEVLLLALLPGITKAAWREGRKRFAFILGAISLCATWLLVLLLLAGTGAYTLHGVYLNFSILHSLVLDPTQLVLHLTPYEACLLLVSVLVGLIITLLLFSLSPLVKHRRRVFSLLIVSAFCFGLSYVTLNVIPKRGKTPAQYQMFSSLVRRQLTPSIALLWSKPIYWDLETVVADIDLTLSARSDLTEYSTQLQDYEKPKHIFVFIVEALRNDIIHKSVEDVPITPTLNRLAQEGHYFKRVYAQSTDSAYSMSSLVTGLYPVKFTYRDDFTYLLYPHVRLFEPLASAGYRSAFFSSANERWQNMINLTFSPALNKFMHSEEYSEQAIADPSGDFVVANAIKHGRIKTGKLKDSFTTSKLIDWLRTSLEQSDQPVFALASFQSSHFPYQQGDDVESVFQPAKLEQPLVQASYFMYPKQLVPVMRNRYRNSLHYIDKQIARIIAALEDLGQLENSVLIVAGDHGELFHEHGLTTHSGFPFEPVARVPIIIWGAGEGKQFVQDRTAMLLDIAPSVLDLAGLTPYEGFQGRSLYAEELPLRPVYISVQLFDHIDAVIVWPWKYVLNRWRMQEFLYRLDKDPLEEVNIVHGFAGVQDCLRELVHQLYSRQIAYYSNFLLHTKYVAPALPNLSARCIEALQEER